MTIFLSNIDHIVIPVSDIDKSLHFYTEVLGLSLIHIFSTLLDSREISMWNVYNLLTGANKSSYIDNFLDRSLNATQLAEGLNKALYGESEYSWFIN